MYNTAGLALMKRQAANSLDEFAKAQDQAFRWGQAQPMWCTTFQEHMGREFRCWHGACY